MSRENQTHQGEGRSLDVNDPRLSRFEIVREGARRDDIEIVHYEPQVSSGSKGERRLTRAVAAFFLLSGVAATAYLIIFIWWPWEYSPGRGGDKYYTPLLGLTLGVALLGIGFGILTWGKKLLPKEVSIQDRHDTPSPGVERKITGQTMLYLADELGVKRRPLLGVSLLAGLAPVAAVAAAPLVGGLISDPHKNKQMFTTGWAPKDGKQIRMVREDGRPIRPSDLSVGGQLTVFPGIKDGVSNKHADSPVLLIHLRAQDAKTSRASNQRVGHADYMWGDYVAYSKICTHAGCPASLYEQQTNILLCPCHQSHFLITDSARPHFGPAHRRLPQLPIAVDDEGFLVAKADFPEAVGPDFWERP